MILGTPLGTTPDQYHQLTHLRAQHDQLLNRIPDLDDLQASWLLLLYCASPRCNYQLRMLPPEAAANFAADHDLAVAACFNRLLDSVPLPAQALATAYPCTWGGWALPPHRPQPSPPFGRFGPTHSASPMPTPPNTQGPSNTNSTIRTKPHHLSGQQSPVPHTFSNTDGPPQAGNSWQGAKCDLKRFKRKGPPWPAVATTSHPRAPHRFPHRSAPVHPPRQPSNVGVPVRPAPSPPSPTIPTPLTPPTCSACCSCAVCGSHSP